MSTHVKKLETQLDQIQMRLSELNDGYYPDMIRQMIHRPGWTTIAEAELVSAGLEALQAQIRAAANHAMQLLLA